jgi:enamine deaminase RidA (YjgF/YER057c/UK114 family)
MTQQTTFPSAHALVEYINPDRLHKNPAFTQVISVSGPVKTIYVGGQDAVDAQGIIVGKEDLKAQTAQVLANLREALAAAGAGPEHIIKWNMYLVQGQSLQEGFQAFQQFWGLRPNPPTIIMAYVSGLANPDFLIEMDAVAVVPLA